MEIVFSSGGGAEGTGAEFSVWDQSCECRSGLQLPSSPCPASRTPRVGEQCKECKQCKKGHGRVVERSATPGTSSEIPLRSPTHTHSSSSSTPADALTARKGTILQQPICDGSQRPALPIFLFRGSFFLHIRTPILQQLELTFARMGLQNDLGANLF